MAQKLEIEIVMDANNAIKEVKALDKAIGGLAGAAAGTDKSVGLFNKTIIASCTAAGFLTRSIDSLTGFAKDSVKAAIEAEEVQSKLDSTLRAQGESVQVVGGMIDEFASQMQSLTGETDEEVKSLATLAYNLGINNDLVKEAVQGAIGLTTIYGGSTQANLEAVAKAFQGQWRQVDALIPEVKSLADESEKLALLQKKMDEGFTASTEAMQAQAGHLKIVKNQWDDFEEAVGKAGLAIFGAFKSAADSMTGHTAMLRKLQAQQSAYNEAIERAKKTHLSYADIIADEGVKDKEIADILAGIEKTRGEIAEIIRKDETAAKEKAAEEAIRARDKALRESTEYIINERWNALNKQIEQEQAWIELLNSKFTPSVVSFSDAWGENVDVAALAQEGLDSLTEANRQQAQTILDGVTPAVKEWRLNWEDANDVMQFAESLIGGITDILGELGVELNQTSSGLLKAAGGFGSIWAGIASKNPLQIIQGVTQAIGGLIKALSGDGIGEAIERENQFMQLNEKLEDQLRDLADELGSVHEATSVMFDEIIQQADITIANFDEYALRLRGILSDFDSGAMTLGETTKEIGDAFSALIEQAGELGMEGSSGVLALFDDLASRGIEVAEITKYINEQMNQGLEGYKKYLEGGFSDATLDVFEDLLAYEKKLAANEGLISGIEGITQALMGLSNTTRLTEAEFDEFEQAANDAFGKLKAQGFTSREALQELTPMLSRLNFLNQEYGLTLDASTQALLDQAKAEGINLDKYKSQEEIFGDMSASLRELVDIFKNVFPSAIDQTTRAFGKLNGEAGEFGIDYVPKGDRADIQAASGFYSPALPRDTVIQAHRGEEVKIIPASGGGREHEGGKSLNVVMHLNGTLTPQGVADVFLSALRSNTRGLRSGLEQEFS
ncbi:MAG TPA: hypothetical protein PK919_02340 [Candidatus Aminicenantes bacterium]|nr:hypothetical protein [Candidatus Aminicenantes bacterium]